MLSYQHMYHCGNLADVHKHYILCEILHKLKEKNKPVSYIETHSGAGLYNLNSEESNKTLEYLDGIKAFENKLNDSIYINILNKIKTQYNDNTYPGSPILAQSILDENDSLNLMELHTGEYQKLKHNLYKFKNTHIHHRDGYQGVLAISPTPIKRGIIFIDPSYEIKSEYDEITSYILKLHNKWKEAVIVIWYPILENNLYLTIKNRLLREKLPKFYLHEIYFDKIQKAENFKLLGSGIAIINLPYGSEINFERLSKFFK